MSVQTSQVDKIQGEGIQQPVTSRRGAGSAISVGESTTGMVRAERFEALQDKSFGKSKSGSLRRDDVEGRSRSYDKAEALGAANATSVCPSHTASGKSKSMDRMSKAGARKGKQSGSPKMTREVSRSEDATHILVRIAPVLLHRAVQGTRRLAPLVVRPHFCLKLTPLLQVCVHVCVPNPA